MPDYSKCVIYKICCNDTSINDIYVGSTCNFRRRKTQHKSHCHNQNAKEYNLKVYEFIRDHGGWENWSMVMIHEEAVENKLQKGKLERQFIDELKPSLNINIPTRTYKEYHEDHKEFYKQYRKKHYQDNKEYYIQKNNQYYLDNRNQKFDCECGGRFNHTNKAKHFKTKKHQKFINALNN